MRPQSGHRAQHAYYVMRKQRHGVDLAIYRPKVWHRGARGAASGGPRCGIGGFWGSKRASLGGEKCTVGAYEFDMLKKHGSSATVEKWGPAAVGQSRGETLSKQVHLGRV